MALDEEVKQDDEVESQSPLDIVKIPSETAVQRSKQKNETSTEPTCCDLQEKRESYLFKVESITVPETEVSSTNADDKTEMPNDFSFLVEEGKRLSKSALWDQMRRFYDTKGVEAWSNGIVPFFITCNSFVAQAYSKTIHGYIRDIISKGEFTKDEPIYIIELGAGSGKFSFLLLKALLERASFLYGDEENVPFSIKYVMTDFSFSNFKFWQNHPSLQRYLMSGVLDFATFDATKDESIKLQLSGKTLTPCKPLSNPLIVVANYLFDSLPADAFCVKQNGSLCEGKLSIYSDRYQSDKSDPEILNHFKPVFSWNNITNKEISEYYCSYGKRLNSVIFEILTWYKEHFKNTDASFLLPIESLRCLDRLSQLSRSLMVVSGDKGNSQTSAFIGTNDPHIAVHGSFSLMVNYHALGLWFDSLGGFALHCPMETVDLKVSAFVIPGSNIEPFARDTWIKNIDSTHWNAHGIPKAARIRSYLNLKTCFQDNIAQFGPNSFFNLQRICDSRSNYQDDDNPRFELDTIIGMLRLSNWDPDLFYKLREDILHQVTEPKNAILISDIANDVGKVWENHYHIELDRDIAYELGRFYYGIQYYEKALVFYMKSTMSHGTHHITEFNKALCHVGLGDTKTALNLLAFSLELQPNYSKALDMQKQLMNPQNTNPNQEVYYNKQPDKCRVEEDAVALRNKSNLTHRITIDPEVLTRERVKIKL